MTAGKADKKFHYRHSGYPGGLTLRSYSELLDKQPEETFRRAVKGMLPKGALGRQMLASSRCTPARPTPTRPRAPSPWSSTPAPTGPPERRSRSRFPCPSR
jgi:large subunit ribosomal protein L13